MFPRPSKKLSRFDLTFFLNIFVFLDCVPCGQNSYVLTVLSENETKQIVSRIYQCLFFIFLSFSPSLPAPSLHFVLSIRGGAAAMTNKKAFYFWENSVCEGARLPSEVGGEEEGGGSFNHRTEEGGTPLLQLSRRGFFLCGKL